MSTITVKINDRARDIYGYRKVTAKTGTEILELMEGPGDTAGGFSGAGRIYEDTAFAAFAVLETAINAGDALVDLGALVRLDYTDALPLNV